MTGCPPSFHSPKIWQIETQSQQVQSVAAGALSVLIGFCAIAAGSDQSTKKSQTEETGSEDTHFSVEVKEIECEETHTYLDVFHLYILPLTFAQLLERHQLACRSVYGHSLRVQHE